MKLKLFGYVIEIRKQTVKDKDDLSKSDEKRLFDEMGYKYFDWKDVRDVL